MNQNINNISMNNKMQTNELADYELNEWKERNLSSRLCSVSGDLNQQGELYSYMVRLVREGKYDPDEFKKYNSYIMLNPIKTSNGNVLFYPQYEPLKEVTAKLLGYKPIFNNAVALVLAETNNKRFFYFDPKAQETDYEKLLGLEKSLRLAMVGCDGVRWDLEDDSDEESLSKDELIQYREKGFSKAFYLNYLDGLYTTIFDVLNQYETFSDTSRLIVRNPLNLSESLELITHLEPGIKPKRISGDFYFLGHPKVQV
jgi:hypothetical protein